MQEAAADGIQATSTRDDIFSLESTTLSQSLSSSSSPQPTGIAPNGAISSGGSLARKPYSTSFQIAALLTADFPAPLLIPDFVPSTTQPASICEFDSGIRALSISTVVILGLNTLVLTAILVFATMTALRHRKRTIGGNHQHQHQPTHAQITVPRHITQVCIFSIKPTPSDSCCSSILSFSLAISRPRL